MMALIRTRNYTFDPIHVFGDPGVEIRYVSHTADATAYYPDHVPVRVCFALADQWTTAVTLSIEKEMYMECLISNYALLYE